MASPMAASQSANLAGSPAERTADATGIVDPRQMAGRPA